MEYVWGTGSNEGCWGEQGLLEWGPGGQGTGRPALCVEQDCGFEAAPSPHFILTVMLIGIYQSHFTDEATERS